LRSQVGTTFSTNKKGVRYLELAEGYISRMALDEDGEACGYEFVRVGPMLDLVKKGVDANEALKKSTSTYGRFCECCKIH